MGNEEFILHPGLIQDLEAAFRRNDWTREKVKTLTKGEMLKRFGEVLDGYAEIKPLEYVIDCAADPVIPKECGKGWSVVEHRKGESLRWDRKVQTEALYLSECQKNGKAVSGNELRKEMENQPVLNANVLDYLLAHPRLITEEWKNKVVYFWGTIYRGPRGYLNVRCLYWDGGRWRCSVYWFEFCFVPGSENSTYRYGGNVKPVEFLLPGVMVVEWKRWFLPK